MLYGALRKLISLSLVISVLLSANVEAALYFVTEENAVNSDNFIIDFDGTATDFIDLEFGSSLGSKMSYDILNSKFTLNRDLDLSGNQILDMRVENAAVAPTCDGTNNGRLYYNTTNNFSYVCDGTTWKQIDMSAGSDGTSSETFMIDNDSTGGDMALVFGQTLNERITWNNANSRFDLSDALNVFEDLTVGADTETIEDASFTMDGNDAFIADRLGVEGAIYTDSTATKYQFLDIYGCVRGSAAAGAVASGNAPVIRFDAGGNSQMRCSFPVPDDWIVGTDVNIETYWSPSDATTGDVDFDLLYAGHGVGDTIAPVDFIDTIPGTTYETVAANTELQIYELTADVAGANIAVDEMVNFRFRRSPADAGDTYTGDINIHMMRISYTGKKLR